jgi:hypothetical protein
VLSLGNRRGCDRMEVGFTTTYAISAYHHWCEFESRSGRGNKVCQWLATGRWFSPGPLVSSTNKTDHRDIAEMLLQVALNTIKPNETKPNFLIKVDFCYFDHSYWWRFGIDLYNRDTTNMLCNGGRVRTTKPYRSPKMWGSLVCMWPTCYLSTILIIVTT